MSEIDKHLLVCNPVAWGPPAVQSIVTSCSECRVNVWVAPASRALLTAERVKVLCIPCFLSVAKAVPAEELKVVLVPGQIKELQEALIKPQNN